MKDFISLLFIILLASCSQPKMTKDIIALQNQNNEVQKKITDALIELETKATLETETYAKLQGLWVNVADTTSFMLIDQSKKTDFRENRFYSPDHYFTIGDRCIGTDSQIKQKDKERYMSILNEMRQCYYIEKLTDSILELQYIGSDVRTTYIRKVNSQC